MWGFGGFFGVVVDKTSLEDIIDVKIIVAAVLKPLQIRDVCKGSARNKLLKP